MKLQHGFIGKEEIDKAIKELEQQNWRRDENLLVFRSAGYGGNLVRLHWFKDALDLTEHSVYEYASVDDYREQMLNEDEDYNYNEDTDTIQDEIEDLNDGEILYSISNASGRYTGTDRDLLILSCEYDGETTCYAYEEAMENLKSDHVDETLVIGLLK